MEATQARMLARRVGVSNSKLEAKTAEYVRLATSRLSGSSLGQGELCKTAVCMELASTTLGVVLDASLLFKSSGVSEQVYKNTKATLQKLLGVGSRASARDLCIQFGCVRVEAAVKKALSAYKERFVRRLPPAQQGHVDFSRPVFLATAFYLVARYNKVQVDRNKLLQPLGVTSKEFGEVHASMAELIAELVGTVGKASKHSRAAEGGQEGGGLLEATGGREDSEDECSSSDEEVLEEGMVGQRVNKKQQRRRDFEEWKQKVGVAGPKAKKAKLTERALRQATLSFGGPAAAAGETGEQPPPQQQAGGKKGAAAAAAQVPKKALKEKNK